MTSREEIINNIQNLIDRAGGDPTHIILLTYITALKEAEVLTDEETIEYIWKRFTYHEDTDSYDWACDVTDEVIRLNKLYEIVKEGLKLNDLRN